MLTIALLTRVLFKDDNNSSNYSGIGVGGSLKYFTGGKNGGFYVGPLLQYWTVNYDNEEDDRFKRNLLNIAADLGWKFQFHSGFYMNTGGLIGVNQFLNAKWNSGEPATSDGDTIFLV